MLGLREVHQQKPGEGEKAGTERRREGPSAHTQGRGYRASLIGDFPSGGVGDLQPQPSPAWPGRLPAAHPILLSGQ